MSWIPFWLCIIPILFDQLNIRRLKNYLQLLSHLAARFRTINNSLLYSSACCQYVCQHSHVNSHLVILTCLVATLWSCWGESLQESRCLSHSHICEFLVVMGQSVLLTLSKNGSSFSLKLALSNAAVSTLVVVVGGGGEVWDHILRTLKHIITRLLAWQFTGPSNCLIHTECLWQRRSTIASFDSQSQHSGLDVAMKGFHNELTDDHMENHNIIYAYAIIIVLDDMCMRTCTQPLPSPFSNKLCN